MNKVLNHEKRVMKLIDPKIRKMKERAELEGKDIFEWVRKRKEGKYEGSLKEISL